MFSCGIWFSAPSFWMGGGLESRCVGRVYGADGAPAHHQEHQMLSCSTWFSAPSFWMGGGLESRFVGRVYGADGALHHPHRTHDPGSVFQDHHPSKNSVQGTICCNSTSNVPTCSSGQKSRGVDKWKLEIVNNFQKRVNLYRVKRLLNTGYSQLYGNEASDYAEGVKFLKHHQTISYS